MDKPLPNVPAALSNSKQLPANVALTVLSIEGRSHLRRFLLRCLQDEAPQLSQHEAWADALDVALRQLGESISLGGWLAGFRRAKVLKKTLGKEKAAKASDNEKGKGEKEDAIKTSSKQSTEKQASSSLVKEQAAQSTFPVVQDPEAAHKVAFHSLKFFVSKPVVPIPKPTAKHLLLTVAPFGSSDLSAEVDYEVIHADAGCIFTPGLFTFPISYTAVQDSDASILYGLDGWIDPPPDDGSLQVVGGSFTIIGAATVIEHVVLLKILRLSVFFYFSLILEQHMLSDSHITLHFPKHPKPPTVSVPVGAPVQRSLSISTVGGRPKKELGFWGYLSKKKDRLLSRASNVAAAAPALVRSGSLDLPLANRPSPRTPRTSEDIGSTPVRRLSFISDFRPSFLQPHRDRSATPPPPTYPFESALSLLKNYEDLLSTSPGIRFPPPLILVRLAEKEKEDPKRRLTGDERTALTSILGWVMGKHDPAKHMIGVTGFVQQQILSVLYSQHIPATPTGISISRPSTPSSQRTPSSMSVPPANPVPPKLTHCGTRRNWMTYKFYGEHDECLGEAVTRLCATSDDRCPEVGCHYKRGQHELRWIHGRTRIVGIISPTSEGNDETEGEDDLPQMWESCDVCKKRSSVDRMQDGTYLLSFAKYLEVLFYSSHIFHLSTPLCEHTKLGLKRPSTSSKESSLPQGRFNIVRNFSWKRRVLSFTLSPIDDIYEVSVPRLQMVKGRPGERNDDARQPPEGPTMVQDDERRKLRREIMKFWQGLSDHMDVLTLPRLPSSDDAFEPLDDAGAVTPKAGSSRLPSHPPGTPRTPKSTSTPKSSINTADSFPFPGTSSSVPSVEEIPTARSNTSSSSLTSSEVDSLQRLTNMRHAFQKTEQNLYAELWRTPGSCLNNIRRSFQSAGQGATKRLSAWEAKHAANLTSRVAIPTDVEPDWWKSGYHAVPGGNVIVWEKDWGSIIAFTLSSLDYHRELANMSTQTARSVSVPAAPPPTPDPERPSFFSKTVTGKWFSSAPPQLDPDQEGVVWYEPETCSAVIMRKEHPRDPASLLTMSIPDVLRQKPPSDTSNTPPSSRFGSLSISSGKAKATAPLPLSARARPEVQVSMDAAGGHSSGAPLDGADKILHVLDGVFEKPRSRRNSGSDSQGSSGFVETNIRRGKASSIMSTDSDTLTIGPDSIDGHGKPPPPPPKDGSATTSAAPGTSQEEQPLSDEATPTKSSMTSSLTNTLSAALRYMVKSGEMQTPHKYQHGLLHAASPAIDDKPHIKYDWTIGKRLKFSCTVYYAKQFDSLRRRCGIGDVFLKSMSQCELWMAEGGKSKANFWKTSDDQFIIKTLVNAWNVADLQVLIDMGPAYFRHMDATVNKPTVLAKILGFYTVEIRNLETGATQAKADLLVMENLFYKHNILKTFDLKGIQGRRVKAAAQSQHGSKTLFDGDWIEGQQKALTLLHPHSKIILDEAVHLDSDFLAKSNIMDYSLLLGVCEENKVLACGLVDTIGSYTFAKTLEYKAKQGLNSAKEVTVIPPIEYQHRFVNAMESYFLSSPDRWTRPLDDTKVPSDYRHLPSVL
ncbi:unnamed protein product [Somion occarium]|uniref:PIPK domain-containing protein n=1 Tax=Somion occarium TaxID=3059160 RepID=A0ABP1D3P2_9APHY